MINLLPTETKETLGYARRNKVLRRWAIVLASVALTLIFIGIIGSVVISRSTKFYNTQVAQSKSSLEAQKKDEINAEVQELTGSIQLVIQVLNREVLFSKLLRQIGAVMPSGSVLTNLNINKLSGGLDLQAVATDYQTATQVQLNLKDPNNKVFGSADIVNIQCNSASANADEFTRRYPCSVQIRALFTQNNPFLFINSVGARQ